MTTVWKQRQPGEVQPGGVQIDDVSEHFGCAESALLIHDGRPDWIKDPQTGRQMRCTAWFKTQEAADCPNCHAHLDAGVTMFSIVADGHADHEWMGIDCPSCKKFVWKLVENRR